MEQKAQSSVRRKKTGSDDDARIVCHNELGDVTHTWMGDCLKTGKPSQYVTV